MSEAVSSTQYPSRSKLQRECNDLDCELYRLIGRAERLAACYVLRSELPASAQTVCP